MKLKVFKYCVINIVLLVLVVFLTEYPITRKMTIEFLSFSENTNLKDILAMLINILILIIGIIATIVTVLISMCDKRVLVLMKKYNSLHIIASATKKSLSGLALTLLLTLFTYIFTFLNWQIRIFLLFMIMNILIFAMTKASILFMVIKSIFEETFNDNNDDSGVNYTLKKPD